jgi:uncharacterized protein YbgA (DUF1722 family)/uncharacterized protein YbbK (DUF523 family)
LKNKPTIAVSACLLGENVRYNGGHTKSDWITGELTQFVNIVPICPEVAMGLGTPREEINLKIETRKSRDVRLKAKKSGKDLTDLAYETYHKMNQQLQLKGVNGFILMKNSPSCALHTLRISSEENSEYAIFGPGLFAGSIMARFPNTPKENSGKLFNEIFREHFMKCVFAHYRMEQLDRNIKSLIGFHRRYKYILMEHSPANLKKLGRILASYDKTNIEQIFELYQSLFFETINIPATDKNRINTIMHLWGYFKKTIQGTEKDYFLRLFEQYRVKEVSYQVVVKVLEYLTLKNKQPYLTDQYYFSPYPEELSLAKSV